MINKPLTVMTYEINPFYESDLNIELQELLSKLTRRRREIVEMRFGLEGNHEHTFDQIGDKLDLTRERVRREVRYALMSLREFKKNVDLI